MNSAYVIYLVAGGILLMAALFVDLCNTASRLDRTTTSVSWPRERSPLREEGAILAMLAWRALQDEMACLPYELDQMWRSLGVIGVVCGIVVMRIGRAVAWLTRWAGHLVWAWTRAAVVGPSAHAPSYALTVEILLLGTTLEDALVVFDRIASSRYALLPVEALAHMLGAVSAASVDASIPAVAIWILSNLVVALHYWRVITRTAIAAATVATYVLSATAVAIFLARLTPELGRPLGIEASPLAAVVSATGLTVAWAGLLFTRLMRASRRLRG